MADKRMKRLQHFGSSIRLSIIRLSEENWNVIFGDRQVYCKGVTLPEKHFVDDLS